MLFSNFFVYAGFINHCIKILMNAGRSGLNIETLNLLFLFILRAGFCL